MTAIRFKPKRDEEGHVGSSSSGSNDVALMDSVITMRFPLLPHISINGFEIISILLFLLIVQGVLPSRFILVVAAHALGLFVRFLFDMVIADRSVDPKKLIYSPEQLLVEEKDKKRPKYSSRRFVNYLFQCLCLVAKVYLTYRYFMTLQSLFGVTSSFFNTNFTDEDTLVTLDANRLLFVVDACLLAFCLIGTIVIPVTKKRIESDIGSFSVYFSCIDSFVGFAFLLYCRVSRSSNEAMHFARIFDYLPFVFFGLTLFRFGFWFCACAEDKMAEKVKQTHPKIRALIYFLALGASIAFLLTKSSNPKVTLSSMCSVAILERLVFALLNGQYIQSERKAHSVWVNKVASRTASRTNTSSASSSSCSTPSLLNLEPPRVSFTFDPSATVA